MVRLNRISIQPMLGTVALFSLERAGIAGSERFPAQERLEDRSLERYRRTPELGTRSLILAGDGSFFSRHFVLPERAECLRLCQHCWDWV